MSETKRTHRTCGRCNMADGTVLDLDTGGAYHPELMHCIAALRKGAAERDAVIAAAMERLYATEERGMSHKAHAANAKLDNAVRALRATTPTEPTP